MDPRHIPDDESCSDVYTTDEKNRGEFRRDQEDSLKGMEHLLNRTLLVQELDEEELANMSDINDGNESVLSDNAIFRAEVEVRLSEGVWVYYIICFYN